jgi:ketosteroid isomerase-like protein
MTRIRRNAPAVGLLLLAVPLTSATAQVGQSDLDAFWAEVSRTVAEGDFDGYAATYHEDAILVSGLSGTSYPIAQALDGWKQGFMDTEAGTVSASVEFRFTQRLSDATTAHETGIFHYAVVDTDGQRTEQFVHFEALLVKKQGWKMMMEYQKSVATQEEWDAAR